MTTPERHTDALLPLLLERTIGSAPSILLRDVLESSIPAGIRSYLLAEVTRWLAEDLRTLPRFESLRLDATGRRHLKRALLESLATSYPLSRTELHAALRVSLEFTEAYLTRPQWTLEKFLFEDEERVEPRYILDRLGHLTDYSYLPRLLEGFVRRRGSTPVSIEDFRHLLGKIDDEIVKQHSPRELALLCKPIFDFLLLKNATLDDPIPLTPVLAFFEDKKMKIMTEYIESICRLRGTETITLSQLIGLITELYDGRPPGTPITPSTDSVHPVEEPSANTPDGSVYPPDPFEPEEADGAHLRQPEHSPAAPEPVGPIPGSVPDLPDLRILVSEKQRHRFIRKIFQKDQAYYYGVLATLNALPTWKEASAYLQQIYEINDLDPYAEDVIEFTDTVHQRYAAPPETDA